MNDTETWAERAVGLVGIGAKFTVPRPAQGNTNVVGIATLTSYSVRLTPSGIGVGTTK